MSALIAKAHRAASGSLNQAIGDFTTKDLAALVALHEREVANRLAAESYGREMNAACAKAEARLAALSSGDANRPTPLEPDLSPAGTGGDHPSLRRPL